MTSALRLAYLTSQYPATSHTFISREVEALRQLGVDVQTFSIRPPGNAELRDQKLAAEARTTFTVLRQPLTRFLSAQLSTLVTRPGTYSRTLGLAMTHRVPGLRGLAMSFVYFAEAAVLARELRKRGVSRLHNHFANAGAIVGLLASRLAGVPWSFTMHGISETDYPAGLLLARKIEAAEFVASVSYFGRAQAMRLVAPDHWPKMHVVRCGLPLAALPSRGSDNSSHRLICVGRLSPEKGQAGLLQAFAIASEKVPSLQLVLVGDGPDRDNLKALAGTLGIADRVTFAGRCGEEDTLQQIADSDILALPSFMEGLPIVLMEAMALGTAVIASRVAGIPELVEDGKFGLMFTPSRWDELAGAIERLAGDEALRDRMAKAGRKAVAAEFDIAKSAARLCDLFTGQVR